jgi:hypothetical protein
MVLLNAFTFCALKKYRPKTTTSATLFAGLLAGVETITGTDARTAFN